MELHRIVIRALFAYVVLLCLIRLSGKRTVSEGTPFSFVLALILGDIVDDALWAEVAISKFVTAAGTLSVAHLLVSWGATRSERLDSLVSGAPALVVVDGRPRREGLRGEQMSDKSLAFEMRQHGIEDGRWPEVREAYVEASGQVSVVKAPWAQAVQRRDRDAVVARARR